MYKFIGIVKELTGLLMPPEEGGEGEGGAQCIVDGVEAGGVLHVPCSKMLPMSRSFMHNMYSRECCTNTRQEEASSPRYN